MKIAVITKGILTGFDILQVYKFQFIWGAERTYILQYFDNGNCYVNWPNTKH